ncbi:polysaccharide deacetylase family protein [Algoriphagus vanfongensis]|uniref:polysaccharide deacetylase family protein n=1 Tax=Algoriphagus vanfongensis TaxID=426371 RepID=UPI00041EF7D3|nr:polysaccharide deacetylase family protein [Algoriphagus vanfongensis]
MNRQLSFFWVCIGVLLVSGCTGTQNSHQQVATVTKSHGAIIRGDSTTKEIALIFTGDEFADGGTVILETLRKHKIQASFFFTGNFYRNENFKALIQQLKQEGHYLGAHSDRHLLYCDWERRDSLLVSKEEFQKDLLDNYAEMEKFGIEAADALYFLPPYEWYNDSISQWTEQMGFRLINYTPGTLSHADYTSPEMTNYRSSEAILSSIYDCEKQNGMEGFLLLSHIGVTDRRQDKFYHKLDDLILRLESRGYTFKKMDKFLKEG